MAKQNRQQAGTSDRLDFRPARAVGSPDDSLFGGNLGTNKPASAFSVANGALTAEIAIAGDLLIRLRGLISGAAGGTFTFQYLRPAASRAAAGQPGYGYDVTLGVAHAAVVATTGTEFVIDINPGGESDLLVTFTPAGTGAFVFLDVMGQ